MRNPPKPAFKLRLEELAKKRIAGNNAKSNAESCSALLRQHLILKDTVNSFVSEPTSDQCKMLEPVEPPKNHFWLDFIFGLLFALFVFVFALTF